MRGDIFVNPFYFLGDKLLDKHISDRVNTNKEEDAA